jgi:hypothetical protein
VESCSMALALCCNICILRRRPCDSIIAVYQLHTFARQRAHHLRYMLASRTHRCSMGQHQGSPTALPLHPGLFRKLGDCSMLLVGNPSFLLRESRWWLPE